MNIKPLDYFSIKSFLGEKIKSSSLKFGRNNRAKKYIIKKKFIPKSPITKNILPKINRLNSLIETKRLSTDKKFISYFNNEKTENTNTYIINDKKKVFNIPFRNSLTHISNGKKRKLINKRNNDKIPSYYLFTFINNINSQNENIIMDNNENKAIKLRKTINLYYSKIEEKNEISIKNENKEENLIKEKENQDANYKNRKRNSMFMTEMNFLINNKNKRKIEIKGIKYNKENELKNTNYDSINFKELLKHIERDKKKIINNQNDIDNMLKTTKDTFYEIWRYKHH